MKTYYLVSRKNEVLARVEAQAYEQAVELMANKVGTAGMRASDCIMSHEEYEARVSCTKANAESKHTPISFPKVYGITTHSKHGSAGLFTVDGSYNPLDATAQSLSPELVLARAHFAADAINSHPELLRQRDELREALKGCAEIMQRAFPNGLPVAQGTLCEEQDWNTSLNQASAALASADKGDK